MDALLLEHAKLERTGNLSKTITDVQRTIDLLTAARDSLPNDDSAARQSVSKLQKPVQQSCERVNTDLKEVYRSLNSYTKALDKKFKDKPLPTAENDALSSHPALINRAIAMHLLREGQFTVASTFIAEANAHTPLPEPTPGTPNPYASPSTSAWESDLTRQTFSSKQLQQQFEEMYTILKALKEERDLGPAIRWARENSHILESRGSNLEFELCKLQFVCLYLGHQSSPDDMQVDQSSSTDPSPAEGPLRAWAYVRSASTPFLTRYSRELQQLAGSLSFWPNLEDSPYRRIFFNPSVWEEVATSFTREFCSLLGLSADSPLYIAATAGAIALPILLKLQTIMKEKRTEWTTQNELPVCDDA